MKFNLSARKTDAEWSNTLYSFINGLTRQAYTLVGWVMILAAISFLEQESDHWILNGLKWALYGLLIAYVVTYFTCRFEVRFWDEARQRKRWQFAIELAFNVTLAVVLIQGLLYLSDMLLDTLIRLQS